MDRVFLDFETFWSDEFTLKKMTPIGYVMDPRFEELGCAFVWEGKPPYWVDGPDLAAHFNRIDWPNTFCLSHNALFDALILAIRYGVRAGFWGDTLSMARNWLSHSLSSISLGSVAEYYGMPAKWGTVNKTKGISYAMLRQMPELHREVGEYGIDDALKCRQIFNNMMRDGFPPPQLEVIDMIIRMATEPAFELDQLVLAEYLAKVKADKQALLDAIGMDPSQISSLLSDQQLATKLLFLGVDVPMKISKGTGKLAYAFAKTDKEFTALLEHEEPFVQALVAARLGHKSTIEETRTQRLIAVANATDKLPVPLKYSGAHTHRLSGDWSLNLQNLKRGGELRKAIKAPDGMKVVAIDASQIEARLNAVLSGQLDLVEAFRQGRDVYAEFAEDVYHYPVTKAEQPIERFVGKTGILSLGYGASPPVFQAMCRNEGNVNLTDAESISVVYLYRHRYKQIVQNWSYANNVVLPQLADISAGASREQLAQAVPGLEAGREWGPLKILHNAILLPSGNLLRYRDLRHELGEGGWQWSFMRGATLQKIYGAKLVENVIQALAFCVIMEVAIRVKKMTNDELWPKHQVHDELLYVVADRYAEMVRDLVVKEMSKPPIWMPTAPLAAEGHIGQNYWAAK